MVIFDAERYKYSGLKYLYECGECGLHKPNYPVPAIPLTVDYWHDTVGMFAWNNPDAVNGTIVNAWIK